MSILSNVSGFIQTEMLGIEKDTPIQIASQKVIETPVIRGETKGSNEDVFERQETKNETGTIKNAGNLSIGALKENLKSLSTKYGFISKEFNPEKLLQEVVGLSKEELEKLSPQDRTRVQNAVDYAMKEYYQMAKQGVINKDADLDKLTVNFCKLVYEALRSGTFKDAQDYGDAVGDVIKELGENFLKLSVEEQREVLKTKRTADDKALEKELSEANSLPEAEQEQVKNKIRARHRFVQRGKYMQLATCAKSETAMNGLVILKSDDLAWGADITLNTRCSAEERTQTADYADYDFTQDLIKDFKAFNDVIKPEYLKDYSCTVVTYKSEEGVKSYQQSYVEDRNKYEKALEKQARGETLTAEEQELLTIMSNDYYTATAQAIGEGALNNVNMTNSQKAEFLAQWEGDAKQYSDYQTVTQVVKEELAENPKYSEIAEEFESIKIKARNVTINNKKTVNTESEFINPKSLNEVSETQSSVLNYSNESNADKLHSENKKFISNPISNKTLIKKNNPIIVASKIKKLGIEEAIKEYGKTEVITAILDNNNLKHLRPLLGTIIKSYDKNSIKEIATNCSDSAFVYICSIVDGNMIAELTENRRDLCFAARNQIENMEKEYEAA